MALDTGDGSAWIDSLMCPLGEVVIWHAFHEGMERTGKGGMKTRGGANELVSTTVPLQGSPVRGDGLNPSGRPLTQLPWKKDEFGILEGWFATLVVSCRSLAS